MSREWWQSSDNPEKYGISICGSFYRGKARDIRPERVHAEVRYQDLQWSDAEIAVRAKAPKEPGSWTFREDIRPVQSLHRLDP